MPATLEQFVSGLQASGLMTAAEVEEIRASINSHGDINSAAERLIRQKKLTPFQAQELIAGNASNLVFGDYLVLDKIGEGGMGTVYKARHRQTGKVAALKVLHQSVTASSDAVKRFQREVLAATRLKHPNIVSAYDAGSAPAGHFFVMELVEGIDLARKIKQDGPLPVDDAIGIILQAASGLGHAHERGVVHRDIKPSNLLLDNAGTVKILDMGLARLIDTETVDDETGAENLTRTGEILGSFDYMAPEQAIDTKRVDFRADIYSLGCTLYFLLTGRPPYRGDTTMQKLLAHRDQPIPSLRRSRPDVPLALDAVLQRMLAKLPDDRYASMNEVIRDLKNIETSPERSGTNQVSVSGTLIICGTVCLLAVLILHFLLAYFAAANRWEITNQVLFVKWYHVIFGVVLFTGIGMIVTGTVMSGLVALVGLFGRARITRFQFSNGFRRVQRLGRWMLGTLAGMSIGALGGAALGTGLATHPSVHVRAVGGGIAGMFVGLALAGRRGWWLTLACTALGVFLGSETSRLALSLRSFGANVELAGDNLALAAGGLVGLVVGGVLGGRLALRKTSPRRPTVSIVVGDGEIDADYIADNATVRRPPPPRETH
ncbi:MAG: hypothetical protein KatS3mg105_4359 [Gemmatales bacterium]|nr:MAG: hypothetical protein KatS3mg105_4359 [Gemmatales bacterium]